MEPLATVEQLTARLRQPLDTTEATQALTDASGLVRAIARQTISFVAGDTVILVGGDRTLTLPQRPAVVDDAHPLTVVERGVFGGEDIPMVEHRDFERVGNVLTRGYPWYWTNNTRLMGWPYNRPLGVWGPRVQVTYSHGYQTIPDDVIAIVLDVAQVLWSNPDGLRSKTVGGYSETYATETLGRDLVERIRTRLSVTGRRRGVFSVRQM
ncbi:hypothetical protein NE236_41360 [Actinoallomurus purpureus]|uniref:hypothetical protein n=1 Tax=Actinoallomurus purpureus TaxID=478114 RepID=UPI002092FBEA|nr:hypothetical protein [Actinoallomurus purpureus]MCO6011418.1 hypothetical protein [Actinoallomurus purpureus]